MSDAAIFNSLVDGVLIALVKSYWTVILTIVLASIGVFVYISKNSTDEGEVKSIEKPLRLIQSSSNISKTSRDRSLSFTKQISNSINDFQVKKKKKRETIVDDMVNNFVRDQYKSELKLPNFLSIQTVKKGVKRVMRSYKQNEIYKKVTKSTRGGDGLASIYNRSRNRVGSFNQDLSMAVSDIEKPRMRTSASIIDFLNNEPFKEPTDEAIFRALNLHITYSWIPKEMLKYIVSQVSVVDLVPGEVLYSAGDTLDYTCVVVAGEIGVVTESVNALAEECDENIDLYDYKLFPGHGSNAFSEVLQLITDGSFDAVVTLTATKPNTKVLKLTAERIRHVDTIFPGFEEQFILKTLIRLNKETFFTLSILSGSAILKNPDISSIEIDEDTRNGVLDEVDEMFETFYADGQSQARVRPSLSRIIARELGLSVDDLGSKLTFRPFDVTLSVKKRFRQRRLPKLLTRSSFVNMPASVLQVMKLDKGADVFKIVSDASIYFVLKGSLSLCSAKVADNTKFKSGGPAVLHRQHLELSVDKRIKQWESFGHFAVATACFDSKFVSKEKLLKSKLHRGKQCLVASETEGAIVICLQDEIYLRLLRGFPSILTNLSKHITTNIVSRQVREVEIALKRKACSVGETVLQSGIRTEQVSVVTHGRLMLKRTMANKDRTSVYSQNVAANGFNIPSAFGFGNNSSTENKESLRLKFVNKQPTKTVDLKILHRGDTFGRFSLFTKSLNPFSVETLRYTQLMCLPNTVMKKIFFGNSKSVHAFGSRLGSFMEILLGQDDAASRAKEDIPKVFAVMPASIQANVDLFLHVIIVVLQNMGIRAQVLNSSIINKILQKDGSDNEIKDTVPSFLQRENSKVFSSFENFASIDDLSHGGDDSERCSCSRELARNLSLDEENRVYNVINEVEDANDILFLVVDARMCAKHKLSPTWWSTTCVKQSDVVLHVANAHDAPDAMPLEERLSNAALDCNLRRELVLLHFPEHTQSVSKRVDPLSRVKVDKFREPSGTAAWIAARDNICQHHHLRVHLNSGMDEVSEVPYMNSYNLSHFKSDFRRFVRWILGNSVTLALGGGGARGIAHIAILKVLEENGVPIDFVSGTSIGAFMGALYAWKTSTLYMYKDYVNFCDEMSSYWRPALDLTIPIVSYFSGYSFNKSIIRLFEDRKIEDLWLPYFCMTTDLTDSCEIAHRNGSLWRYVRASMTLVNLVPPLCDVEVDPNDSTKRRVHYLADGGYVNNLPVDVMRNLTGDSSIVIAVDIQSEWSIEGDDYGETYSGFQHLLKVLNPFVRSPSVPTNFVIQTQLAFIASVRQGGVGEYKGEDDSTEIMSTGELNTIVKQAVNSQNLSKAAYTDIFQSRKIEDTSQKRLRNMIDLFLHPPVEKYGTLEFHKRKEIESRSEEYAKLAIEQWMLALRNNEGDDVNKFFGLR